MGHEQEGHRALCQVCSAVRGPGACSLCMGARPASPLLEAALQPLSLINIFPKSDLEAEVS